MAVMKVVENSVQAKSVIESFEAEGYLRDHIHIFAHNTKRAEDIATALHIDAGSVGETNEQTGFLETIKNFFSASSDDLHAQLSGIGLHEHDQEIAKEQLELGKLVIVAHHPQE